MKQEIVVVCDDWLVPKRVSQGEKKKRAELMHEIEMKKEEGMIRNEVARIMMLLPSINNMEIIDELTANLTYTLDYSVGFSDNTIMIIASNNDESKRYRGN